ncbi:MAG TPA: carboxypeptidase-like regulatory domain-containing protein [Candidatus Cybelea sp.]|nr:carboxypeptidase-like regulatory domain-containing protein [Candidatus Cybelea sp.]
MRSLSLRLTFVTLAALMAFASQSTWALAGTSGGIAGVVTDSKTGAPISDVKVKLSSPSQAATATTDAHGHYIVFSLQPDDYTLTLEKSGYVTKTLSGYSVYADQTQRYDITLTEASPGAAQQ